MYMDMCTLGNVQIDTRTEREQRSVDVWISMRRAQLWTRNVLHALVEGGISYESGTNALNIVFFWKYERNLVRNPTLASMYTWYCIGISSQQRWIVKERLTSVSIQFANDCNLWTNDRSGDLFFDLRGFRRTFSKVIGGFWPSWSSINLRGIF